MSCKRSITNNNNKYIYYNRRFSHKQKNGIRNNMDLRNKFKIKIN